MICVICGESNKWHWVRQYREPDKYERYVGLGPTLCRRWYKCLSCGVYRAERNYPLSDLMPIYTNGYRDPRFRGETAEEVFEKVLAIPWGESENSYRTRWLQERVGRGLDILDIGGGLGVFPYVMQIHGHKVAVVEPNEDSVKFMRSRGLRCFHGLFEDVAHEVGKWELVSMVHILEHVEDPDGFLYLAKECLGSNGRLYIEVPDAVEFDYLPEDHDEFNSCHVHFFDLPTLYKLVEAAEFRVEDAHRIRYKKRNLSRILMLARC